MDGAVTASGKMRVGYFTQYQVEELHGEDTPLQHMTRAMGGSSPAAVRAQLGRFGFSGDKAITLVGKLSGGERARLALALITREAPHLLILDEPTNHLDVDSREALVQALNGYSGAVIIVSHDRHMIELTADRLLLVENGGATEYPGSVDDYIALILGRGVSTAENSKPKQRHDRKAAAKAREDARTLKKAAAEAEAASAELAAQCSVLDRAMFDPANAPGEFANMPMSELSKRRAEVASQLEAAEARWIEANEQLERMAA